MTNRTLIVLVSLVAGLAATWSPPALSGPIILSSQAAQSEVYLVSRGLRGPADGSSFRPIVSTSGRFVAFLSNASNLIDRAAPSNLRSVYLRDLDTGESEFIDTTCLTPGVCPYQAQVALSADATVLAYTRATTEISERGNLRVLLRDQGASIDLCSAPTVGDSSTCDGPAVSADGRYVAYSRRFMSSTPPADSGIWLFDTATRQEQVVVRMKEPLLETVSDLTFTSAGDVLVFSSSQSDLITYDRNASSDVFTLERGSGRVTRVSVTSGGHELHGSSRLMGASDDGRYIAFLSSAWDVVDGDDYGFDDVFIHDRVRNETYLAAQSKSGGFPAGDIIDAALSRDGRFLAFSSAASDIVVEDHNQLQDVFVRDLATGTTSRVSIDESAGELSSQSSMVSRDGISADGSAIVFWSSQDGIVEGDANAAEDAYVSIRDLPTPPSGTLPSPTAIATRTPEAPWRVEALSVDDRGDLGPGHTDGVSLSADGRLAVIGTRYSSFNPQDPGSNRKPGVFLRDRATRTTRRVSGDLAEGLRVSSVSIAGNGSRVLYLIPDTPPSSYDWAFISDLQEDTATSVCIGAPDQVESCVDIYDATLTQDGEIVALTHDIPDLVYDPQVYIKNLRSSGSQLASISATGSRPNGPSGGASISSDASVLVFESRATDIDTSDGNQVADVFLRDLQALTTTRISRGPQGEAGDGESSSPVVSADGRFVAYTSLASNLARDAEDASILLGNGSLRPQREDAFLLDRCTGRTTLLTERSPVSLPIGSAAAISADGRFVVVASRDPSGSFSVVLRADAATGALSLVSRGMDGKLVFGMPGGREGISADGRMVAFVSDSRSLGAEFDLRQAFLWEQDAPDAEWPPRCDGAGSPTPTATASPVTTPTATATSEPATSPTAWTSTPTPEASATRTTVTWRCHLPVVGDLVGQPSN